MPRRLLRPAEEGHGRGGIAERAADREDPEPDSGEQERDADDDPEQRELLCHVARVERRGQRRLGDPEVAGRVVDGLLRLRVEGRVCGVVRPAVTVRELLGRPGFAR